MRVAVVRHGLYNSWLLLWGDDRVNRLLRRCAAHSTAMAPTAICRSSKLGRSAASVVRSSTGMSSGTSVSTSTCSGPGVRRRQYPDRRQPTDRACASSLWCDMKLVGDIAVDRRATFPRAEDACHISWILELSANYGFFLEANIGANTDADGTRTSQFLDRHVERNIGNYEGKRCCSITLRRARKSGRLSPLRTFSAPSSVRLAGRESKGIGSVQRMGI